MTQSYARTTESDKQSLRAHGVVDMGWLWLVGSIKLQVSCAESCLFYRALLQKRPVILSILLTEATPYVRHDLFIRVTWHIQLCSMTHLYVFPWLIHMHDLVFEGRELLIMSPHMYNMIHSYIHKNDTPRSKWHASFKMTRLVQNDAFIRITCLVHTGDITYECVPWLIQTDLVFESKELLIEHQVLFFEMPLHLYILYI